MSKTNFSIRNRRRIRGFESILERIYDKVNPLCYQPTSSDQVNTGSDEKECSTISSTCSLDSSRSLTSSSSFPTTIDNGENSPLSYSSVSDDGQIDLMDQIDIQNENSSDNLQDLADQRDERYGIALFIANFFQDSNMNESMRRRVYELIQITRNLKRPPIIYRQFKCVMKSLNTINVYKFVYCHRTRQYLDEMSPKCCSKTNHGEIAVFSFIDTLKHILEANQRYLDPAVPETDTQVLKTRWYRDIWQDFTNTSDIIKVTLIVNMDEAQMMKSTRTCTIPVPFTIAELPRYCRSAKRNVYNLGIYHGQKQFPVEELWIKTLIEPFLCLGILQRSNTNQCYEYSSNPIEVLTCYGNIKVLVRLGAIVMDTVAKAKCLNIKSFMGYYGCPYCLIEGTRIVDDNNSACFVYPYDQYAFNPRKSKRFYIESARIAEENATCHLGVKGSTVLSSIVTIPDHIPIDYMHAILEGVFKFFFTLYPLKLKTVTSSIDERVNLIKFPHDFSRKFRKISEIAYWKAAECRSFLFYLIPLLFDIVDADSFIFLLALSAVTRGLSINLPSNESAIEKIIECFLLAFQEAYGEQKMRFNLHLLTHIVHQCKYMGSLVDFSAFTFENNIYRLKSSFHGNTGQLDQMSSRYALDKAIDFHKIELDKWRNIFDPSNKLKLDNNSARVDPGLSHFDQNYAAEISLKKQLNYNYDLSSASFYHRFKKDHNVYHSCNYKWKKDSASFYVNFKNSAATELFGKIHCFITAKNLQTQSYHDLAWIQVFEARSDQNSVNNLKPSSKYLKQILSETEIKQSLVIAKESNRKILISTNALIGKIILIPTSGRFSKFWVSRIDIPFDHD